MKNKSIFSQIIILIIVAVLCILLTAAMALIVGSANVDIFDLSNLNISNMIPVMIVGGFISCVVIGIIILIVSKNVFFKAKDEIKNYFSEKDDGGKK